MGLLQEISQKVGNIEVLLGGGASTGAPKKADVESSGKGIDIVLGAQWGDEGKGKLVDMLSQVGLFILLWP
jgi:adenylosuccinate synthase